jgi:small neutral amino acid transporter SnatA (MarC family)
MIVEVDERTYRPRLQTVRFTSGAKVMEFRLATERAETGVVLLVVLLLTYVLLLFSDAILRIIGRQGAAILVRVMGIILCSLAVEIVLTALGVASWAPVPR